MHQPMTSPSAFVAPWASCLRCSSDSVVGAYDSLDTCFSFPGALSLLLAYDSSLPVFRTSRDLFAV
eukprot:scaffold27961_cov51-Attheya_sp.AAC.3